MVGWAVIGVNLVALVTAIGLSVPRLRDHRTAFWIPLICGGLSLLLTFALFSATLAADPAIMSHVRAPG